MAHFVTNRCHTRYSDEPRLIRQSGKSGAVEGGTCRRACDPMTNYWPARVEGHERRGHQQCRNSHLQGQPRADPDESPIDDINGACSRLDAEDAHEKQADQRLYAGITGRDREAAASTPSSEDQPAKDRHIISRSDRSPALRAARPRTDQALAERDSADADIQETPDAGPQREGEQAEHQIMNPGHLSTSPSPRKTVAWWLDSFRSTSTQLAEKLYTARSLPLWLRLCHVGIVTGPGSNGTLRDRRSVIFLSLQRENEADLVDQE